MLMIVRTSLNKNHMIYFIGTKHPDFTSYSYNQGSIIIDPWRYIPEQEKL